MAQEPSEILRYFHCTQLPPHLEEISEILCLVASHIDQNIRESAKKTEGLLKLLEAKNCFVEAAQIA